MYLTGAAIGLVLVVTALVMIGPNRAAPTDVGALRPPSLPPTPSVLAAS